ncbi:MAG: GvpL/GvpF family gas vesicle protein [Pseudomonadota bacterium]
MTGQRLVLGWAHSDVHCPAPIAVRKVGPIGVLLVPEHAAGTARARLQHQLRCFETGMAFVPTAPAESVPENDGARIAKSQQKQLAEALVALDGMGQLTLSMTWASPVQRLHKRTCGRDWLRHRKDLHAEADHRSRTALTFLDLLQNLGQASRTRQQNQGVERDLLVSGARMNSIRQRIQKHAATFEAGDLRLTVTGLWPPFSFVQSFSCNNGVII